MRIAVLFALILTGFTAFANDGGIVGIRVEDLTFKSFQDADGKIKETPIEINQSSPSYAVNMNGGDAAKLMTLLPSTLTVDTTIYGKTFEELYNKNFKTLLIRGKPGQPDVRIKCDGGDLDYSSTEKSNTAPTFKPHPDGAHCSVEIAQQMNDGDMDFNFNPTKAICGK